MDKSLNSISMSHFQYWVKVVTYAAVIFLCRKRCALGKCITDVTSWMMSLLIMIASVWRTLQSTLALVHAVYATLVNDEPIMIASVWRTLRGTLASVHAYTQHSWMMSLLIMIASVWRALRGTLASAHSIYADILCNILEWGAWLKRIEHIWEEKGREDSREE